MSDLFRIVRGPEDTSDTTSDSLLTKVSTRLHLQQHERHESEDQRNTEDQASTENDEQKHGQRASNPEDFLGVLRSQPNTQRLVQLLTDLKLTHASPKGFNIHAPGPAQAQVINLLVNTIVPSFWPVLKKRDANLLLWCLTCVAGIQALFTRLRLLLQSIQSSSKKISNEDIRTTVNVLKVLLEDENTFSTLWNDLQKAHISDIKRELAWKEVVTIFASGMIVGTIAQAEDAVETGNHLFEPSWLSKGSQYSTWLGRHVVSMLYSPEIVVETSSTPIKAVAQLLSKALTLGYSLPLIGGMITALLAKILDQNSEPVLIETLIQQLTASSRRQFFENVLRWLESVSRSERLGNNEHLDGQSAEVSGMTALLSIMTADDASTANLLSSSMNDAPLLSSLNITVLRAAIAVIALKAPDELDGLLEKTLTHFYDPIFIEHGPTIQQEGLAQVVLLCAGYLHQKSPMAVLMSARSSSHMQGVSNRLNSSNKRSRWLGMVVGVAISSLVDKEGSRLNFGTDETSTEEAKWYLDIVAIRDKIGKLSELRECIRTDLVDNRKARRPAAPAKVDEMPIIDGKKVFGPPRPPTVVQTEMIGDRVTEVFDELDDQEDTDFAPYAKPDSDPEDSDEDATLVNRNRPRPPVYIRDLMRMLRDEKDYDRFQLGIKHAAPLIRRKTNFGAEVKDHSEELAGMLCSLQDPFDTPDFDELRLQALIAVLLADTADLAPWLSRQAFGGDYSLSQRCVILSALGLGGRELAGLHDADALNPRAPASSIAFPSKRLPSRLHALYDPRSAAAAAVVQRLEAASRRAAQQLVQPLALTAADRATAHLDAVKVRTFSSRLAAERTRRKPAANELAKAFGARFFHPLVTRYQQELAAYGAGSVFASAPVVLVTFVKTLALLLHASGPATLGLPEITAVFWDLLLSLRMRAAADISVLDAVLFSLLTLLEINGDCKQRLVQETPKQLVETQQWVELVFERTGGGELVTEGSSEESRVRTLAAGVLVKTREVIEAYKKLLIGVVPGL